MSTHICVSDTNDINLKSALLLMYVTPQHPPWGSASSSFSTGGLIDLSLLLLFTDFESVFAGSEIKQSLDGNIEILFTFVLIYIALFGV